MPRLLGWLLVLIIPLRAAVFGSLTPATTYYVNQVIGNDANNGTSTATPFLTIGKLQSVITTGRSGAIFGGSTVQLRYNEELILPAARISIVGYGAFKPLLDCSEAISTGAWSKTAGRTNIYQATVTTDLSITGYINIFQDGSFLGGASGEVTSLAILDATTNAYYVANNGGLSGTTQTLYVNVGGNPVTDGKLYEYNRRNAGIFSQFSATVSNIWTRRGYQNDGPFEVGPGSFFSDIDADQGSKHNLLQHGGSTSHNVTARDSHYNAGKIALVIYDDNPAGDATVVNFTYTDSISAGACLYGHGSGAGQFGLITITNANCGSGSGISGFSSAAMVIRGGTITGEVGMASASSKLLNSTVQDQIVFLYPWVNAEIGNVVASIPVGRFNGCIRLDNNLGANVISLNIHDSTFTDPNPSNGALYVGSGTSLALFSLQRDTFAAPVSTNYLRADMLTTLGPSPSIDYNTYHYPTPGSGALYFPLGTSYVISAPAGWDAWQALGFDTHSSRVTP